MRCKKRADKSPLFKLSNFINYSIVIVNVVPSNEYVATNPESNSPLNRSYLDDGVYFVGQSQNERKY